MELPLLLSPTDAARRLGISRSYFYKILPWLRARGLRRVRFGSRWKYVADDVLNLITKMAA